MLCVLVRYTLLLLSLQHTDTSFTGSSWIDDPQAQQLLFDLLRRTERDNGWPWAYVEQRILQTWQRSPR
jgi:hypothetical protein